MNETKYLEKIDEIILDVISHYGTISLLDLWYELGESCELKEQPVTADGVLSRLEFLSTNGFVKSEGVEWGYFRAKLSSCKSINVSRNCHMEQINSTRCKTKIIATIGPTSRSRALLEQMINAGMNVARLNLSHGSYEDHGEVISTIRSLSKEMNKSVAIVLDLQGPKIRTGKLKDCKPVMLKRNAIISFTTKKVSGTCDLVSTTYANLVADVKKDETLLLADGLIKLKVVSKTQDIVTCKVVNGGVLRENTGINLPGCKVSAPCLTPKDKKDLRFGIESGVDYFALSFVRSADDLNLFKSTLKKMKSNIPVIAKIEKREAVDNLAEILEIADAIMVARGDIGAELRLEQVLTVQKRIIDKAIRANKPVITATQMLETMSENTVPTRAEVSDVANAIFDGTDAVMLSGETATGKYPVEAVQMMARISAEAESSPFMKYNIEHDRSWEELITHAAAQSAVNVLHEVDGKAIISFSVSGKTSKLISKQRPC